MKVTQMTKEKHVIYLDDSATAVCKCIGSGCFESYLHSPFCDFGEGVVICELVEFLVQIGAVCKTSAGWLNLNHKRLVFDAAKHRYVCHAPTSEIKRNAEQAQRERDGHMKYDTANEIFYIRRDGDWHKASHRDIWDTLTAAEDVYVEGD